MQLNFGDHRSVMPRYEPFPPPLRGQMRWVRERVGWIAKHVSSADRYFATLPLHKPLSMLLDDQTIWVNYKVTRRIDGETAFLGSHELAIGSLAFEGGRLRVLATLIHELAHVCGAPIRNSRAAEMAVLACGLGKLNEYRSGIDDPHTQYNPKIIGSADPRKGTSVA